VPTKAELKDENERLKDRVSELEGDGSTWVARELLLKEKIAQLEDNYKQVIAQKELVLELREAVLIYQRISDTVPKELLSSLIDLCRVYECSPEGLAWELVELEGITKELEEKLEI